MYPEAGGSSSFARHAFNEFWSFFAAWAQMLNYTITIAISAFFVPHYLGGLFWEPLRSSPGDIIFGIGVVVALSLVNVVGVKESAGVNVTLALDRLRHAAAARDRRRGARASRPRCSIDNVDLGVAPTWKNFFLAIPVGDDRLHGHRDDLEHGRGGQGRDDDDPEGDQPRRHRRLRDLRAAAGGRAVGAARDAERRPASTRRCSACPRTRAATPATRSSASSTRSTSARCRAPPRSTSACSPRRSCSSRRTRASSASRGSSTRWASIARCPTACASCTRATGRRGSGS